MKAPVRLPRDPDTRRYGVLQVENRLVISCYKCGEPMENHPTVNGLCRTCGYSVVGLGDWGVQWSDLRSERSDAIAEWIKIWTRLEVEVNING